MILTKLLEEALSVILIESPVRGKIFKLFLEGKKPQQIADELSLPVGGVRRHIKSGRDFARDYLTENGVTRYTLIDGRAVPRDVLVSLELLFPQVSS